MHDGARPAKVDYVRCLGGCDKMFWSRDRYTNRICGGCTRKLEKTSPPKVARLGALQNGKPVGLPAED